MLYQDFLSYQFNYKPAHTLKIYLFCLDRRKYRNREKNKFIWQPLKNPSRMTADDFYCDNTNIFTTCPCFLDVSILNTFASLSNISGIINLDSGKSVLKWFQKDNDFKWKLRLAASSICLITIKMRNICICFLFIIFVNWITSSLISFFCQPPNKEIKTIGIFLIWKRSTESNETIYLLKSNVRS